MTYIHAVSGRIRVKSDQFCEGRDINVVCAALAGLEGINSVQFKKRSKSLIVYFDDQVVSEDRVLETIRCLCSRTFSAAATGTDRNRPALGQDTNLSGFVVKVALASLFRHPLHRGLAALVSSTIR